MQAGGPHVASPTKYEAAELSTDAREMSGLLLAHGNPHGITVETMRRTLKSAGKKISKTSLYRWMGSVRKEGSAISPTKKSGNVSKLSLLQKKIIAGHVLYTNDQGNTVSVDDYVHVAWEFFGVKISPSSVSRYMVETHLSV